jgi:hypothetical protein
MTDIARHLPNDEYQAAVNANAPMAANPFATIIDLSGLGGETLAQTLANGKTTGPNDIEISNSQVIKAESGSSSLDLRFSGTDGKIGLLGDFFEATMGTFFVDDAVGSVVANTGAASLSLFKGNLSKLGQISIGYNDGTDIFSSNLPSYPTILSSQDATVKDGVINSNILGGLSPISKTDNTPMLNQLGFNTGEAFETILGYTTATQENTAILQDASGTIAYLSDITPSLSFNVDLDSAESSVSRVFAGGRTTFTITHNLGTLDIKPEVFRLSDGRTIGFRIERTGINTVEVSRNGDIADGLFRILI